jgi:hypothetical protein
MSLTNSKAAWRQRSNQTHESCHPVDLLSKESPDFSLVLGGPLYQMMPAAHLSGDALELVGRRVIVLSLIAWLPLLALSGAEGLAWGGNLKVPFLLDVDVHT